MITWIGIALLGGLGAVCRDLLERRSSLLVVNLVGCVALGALAGAGVHGDARRLAAVGFLGALTSYSGWALEDRRRGLLHLALGLLAAAAARGSLGP